MSHRLSRHFGGDRFLVLAIPDLSKDTLPPFLKAHIESSREAFVKWLVNTKHELLGRMWRAFYIRPEDSKKAQKTVRDPNDTKFRIYLFAIDGQGFSQARFYTRDRIPGEVDNRESPLLERSRVSLGEMIEWFMPFGKNQSQQSLKFFARLQLGLTSTWPTVIFHPNQIVRSDDAYADSPRKRRLDIGQSDAKKTGRSKTDSRSPVMNDGCARISRSAAASIAAKLGLGYIPSVFQGRIAGAKGIWMVDTIGEVLNSSGKDDTIWIEITDSQVKFESPPIDSRDPDRDRVTLDVNAWSKALTSSYLNFQLIPILQDRGVPRNKFKQLLEQDLLAKTDELNGAMEDVLMLRQWCHWNYPTSDNRVKNGGIQMLGGFPESTPEKIVWFLDHGFEPRTCGLLKDLLFQLIKEYCLRLENRMSIGIEFSTNAFILADPLNVLEEGEVHIVFSRPFKDSQGFDQHMLYNVDILVARLPAHLPSDIQKVRAVFRPELEGLRDVIVFSSRGQTSLASKLSGGDYDGDKAWICWDECLVDPFQNAMTSEQPTPEYYGIRKETTKASDFNGKYDYIMSFLAHGFNFNFQRNLLGKCTLYHEALCYTRGDIDSEQAVQLAHLAGHLVDGPKNGFQFNDSDWAAFLKDKMDLPLWFDYPAYKDKNRAKPTNNLIDDLVFNVARKVRESVLSTFDQNFHVVKSRDEDLTQLYQQEVKAAESDPMLKKAIKRLDLAVSLVVDYWNDNRPQVIDDSDSFSRNVNSKRGDSGPRWDTLREECREKWLAITPFDDEKELAAASRMQPGIRERNASTERYWDLLKASITYHKHHQTKTVWYMAGLELGELKATAKGRGTYRTVINPVYEILKPDGRLLDAARQRHHTASIDDKGQALADGYLGGDDDDDEFGDGDEFRDCGSQFEFV